MRKLSVFEFISLNGFFKGPGGDISWHKHGEEEGKYSEEAIQADHMLLFGRVTYEMMVGYWSSPMAAENSPVVAEGMNKADKIVFSRTLEKVEWNNTKLMKNHIVEEIRKMKATPGKDMTILGSGTIAALFADAGLIDEIQVMVDPVVIGSGTPLFHTIKTPLDLRLINTRTFKSGVVLLSYQLVNRSVAGIESYRITRIK